MKGFNVEGSRMTKISPAKERITGYVLQCFDCIGQGGSPCCLKCMTVMRGYYDRQETYVRNYKCGLLLWVEAPRHVAGNTGAQILRQNQKELCACWVSFNLKVDFDKHTSKS